MDTATTEYLDMAKRSRGEADIAIHTDEHPNGVPKVEKPHESKADRFRRLANKRVPRAIKAMRSVAKLGNRAMYDYGESQQQAIMDAVTVEVQRLGLSLDGKASKEPEFRL